MHKYVISLVGLVVVMILAVVLGAGDIGPGDVIYGLFSKSGVNNISTIIWQIRVPRVILGLLVGAGLAGSGAVFQGILKNPLAEPYTLGISGIAALFIFILAFLKIPYLTNILAACFGAGFSIFLIYLIANYRNFSSSQILLGGIMLNFVSIGLISLITALGNPTELHFSRIWLMGSLTTQIEPHFYFSAVIIFLGILFLIIKSRDIDILSLGHEKAVYLGVDAKRSMKELFIAASVVTGLCVAYSGVIAFVGLVIPHIIRHFTGALHRNLIFFSAVFGAIYLCVSDMLARSIIYPEELPVGVITSIIGGLFFIIILIKRKVYN